jgi:hypothetical protein
MSVERSGLWLAAVAGAALMAATSGPAAAEVRRVQDTFTAMTRGMTPEGLNLRIQVLEWSDDDARGDVLAALEDGPALGKLPTVGYVWPAGSPVGYTVKYAHRSMTDDGLERITFVTDKPVGSYDFKKWSVATPAPPPARSYSVIELYVDGAAGTGVGNLSLAADVIVDEATSTLTLVRGGSEVLADVQRQPGA